MIANPANHLEGDDPSKDEINFDKLLQSIIKEWHDNGVELNTHNKFNEMRTELREKLYNSSPINEFCDDYLFARAMSYDFQYLYYRLTRGGCDRSEACEKMMIPEYILRREDWSLFPDYVESEDHGPCIACPRDATHVIGVNKVSVCNEHVAMIKSSIYSFGSEEVKAVKL